MPGFGNVPVGSTPFGAGTPTEAIPPPENPPLAARFLNWETGDYEVADDGEYRRMPIMRQRVLIALGTVFSSSSVLPQLGARLPEIMDDRYPRLAEQAIRSALESMVVAEEIKILSVSIETGCVTGRADHTVAYTDLTTGNQDTLTV